MASRAGAADRRQTVQSAGFGLMVLKRLAAMGGAASLSALAQSLDENPAKLHRYLASLKEEGFVAQDEAGARYVLGEAALTVGLAAMRRIDVLNVAPAEIAALTEAHDVASFVAVFGNRGPTIMRWEEPMQPVTVNVRVGSVLPILWSATGRAFAASMKSALLDSLIRDELAAATPARRAFIGSPEAAAAMLAEVRDAGCATICDTLLGGVSAVAAPILDFSGRVVAVMTALGTTGAIDANPQGALARDLRGRCARVSRALGWPPST